MLTSGPVLRHFDPSGPIEIHSDASAIGGGVVRFRPHEEEQQKDSSVKLFFVPAQASQASTSPFVVRDGLPWRRNYSSDGARFLLVVGQSHRYVVLHAMHDNVTSGHLGFARTIFRLRQSFYWPRLWKTTKPYVAGCQVCQRYKHPTVPRSGHFNPVRPPTSPKLTCFARLQSR